MFYVFVLFNISPFKSSITRCFDNNLLLCSFSEQTMADNSEQENAQNESQNQQQQQSPPQQNTVLVISLSIVFENSSFNTCLAA